MTARAHRPARLLLASALLTGAAVLTAPSAPAASATSAATARAPSVVVAVEDVSPSVPQPTGAVSPMTFTVRVTNVTSEAIRGIRVTAARETLLIDQKSLTQQLAQVGRTPGALAVPATTDVEIPVLAAHGSVVTAYRITTGTTDHSVSLCLCNQGIYSIYLRAQVTASDGSAHVLGGARTFVPSVVESPPRQQIAWVWPLIDRPHRLTSDTIFLDDELAGSVSSGGRLDRALKVAEDVGSSVPLTLVVDPELLDELSVMAAGYRVEVRGGQPVSGSGQLAAQLWLDRLGDLLRTDAGVEVALTPYADPDQRALADRGQGWTTGLPTTNMTQRVTTALAGRALSYDLAWPSAGVIDADTVRALTAGQVTTAVLDQATLVATQRKNTITRVRLRSGSTELDAAITAPAIQSAAAGVVTVGGAGTTGLAPLLAQIAIRSVTSGAKTGFLVITPPRYVDPSPTVAARAILATSSSLFSTPIPVRSATVLATTAGTLTRSTEAAPLPTTITDAIGVIDRNVPALRDMLVPSTIVTNLLTNFSTGRQRLTSSGWRPDVGLGGATLGSSLATRVQAGTAGLLAGVHIVPPSSGTYTLASSDSKLPIAVRNELTLPVRVRVDVFTEDNLPGLSATPLTRTVEARSQTSFRIQTKVDRAGVIPVRAQLATPGGASLGRPVRLSIHSTVLGKVGVIITAVAGGVLVIALLVRLGRRTRRRGRRAAPAVAIEREPVA